MGQLPTQTYHEIAKDKITSDELRSRLKLKHYESRRKISERHPKAFEFFKQKGIDLGKIREHSAKLIGAGTLAGSLLLNFPSSAKGLPTPQEIIEGLKKAEGDKKGQEFGSLLVNSFQSILPKTPRPLTRNEEKVIEQIIQNVYGVPARASLEGEHLNTTYGYVGAEQHLRRYPGDTLGYHGDSNVTKEGMAPGLGAWGYFAPSRDALTPQLEENEKWYAVVQTLYLPDWNTRQPNLKNWYKYRKVLMVNTQNGNAVVASIADSGPAAWTGKHYGGSPEVMDYLGGPKYKKGPVIVFFVDDPENKVPLGPVEYRSHLADTIVN